MKIEKRTFVSLLVFINTLFLLWVLLVFGLDWNPIPAVLSVYLLAIFGWPLFRPYQRRAGSVR